MAYVHLHHPVDHGALLGHVDGGHLAGAEVIDSSVGLEDVNVALDCIWVKGVEKVVLK